MCFVIMKRSFSVFFSSALFGVALAAFSAQAQVVPSATARQFSLTAGALGSAFQPDYDDADCAEIGCVQSNPDYLFGVGAYVDLRLTRWIQIEAESHWLRFNSNLSFNESNYLGGFRVPVRRFGRFTPYGKVLGGFSAATFLDGHAPDITFGGGVDYRLTKRISLRAADFEYQYWYFKYVNPVTLQKTDLRLSPYGFSVGIGYKVF
jgi:opacity protein-like surface antigen